MTKQEAKQIGIDMLDYSWLSDVEREFIRVSLECIDLAIIADNIYEANCEYPYTGMKTIDWSDNE